MNSNGADKLRDTLSQRSEVMSDSHVDFTAMQQQAKGIRRRRRIGTGVAAAAVLAVIAVPTTLMLDGTRDDSAPGPATGSSAAPEPTTPTDRLTTPPGEGDGSWPDRDAALAALEGLPQGADPQVDVFHDGQVRTAAGDTLDVPQTDADVETIISYHGGWLLATQDSNSMYGDATVRQFDAQGDEVNAIPGTATFAVSNDGTRAAWWTYGASGELHVAGVSGMAEGDGMVHETGPGDYVIPIGFVADGEVVYQATGKKSPTVKVTDFAGNERTIDGLFSAESTDETNNRIAGRTDSGGTWRSAVVDAATGEEVWHKDGWTLGRFSPDGEYVIGFSGDADPMRIGILDADTGDVVAEVDLLHDYGLNHVQVVWEEDSVLVSAFVMDGTDAEPHAGALLRIGLDGSVERASSVESDGGRWVFLPRG